MVRLVFDAVCWFVVVGVSVSCFVVVLDGVTYSEIICDGVSWCVWRCEMVCVWLQVVCVVVSGVCCGF